ncbi:MAG: hypothetical protein ACHQEM_04695 [Chitinophagales bacterium]
MIIKRGSLLKILALFVFFQSCEQRTASEAGSNTAVVSEFRNEIRKEPIATYKEKVENSINDWYFSVQLFETKKTFSFLLKMQYEEVRGEDTVKIPDFGMEPKPVIRKGKDHYSCIIGFMDKENQFREYKEVSVKEGRELKLTTLNHYTVVAEPAK